VVSGITLTAAKTVRVDAKLDLGQLTESVQVTAQAVQMQTEDAKVSTAVENRMVDQLPLVVGGALRSAFDLVSITPEAKGSGNAVSLGGARPLRGALRWTVCPSIRTGGRHVGNRLYHAVGGVAYGVCRRHEWFIKASLARAEAE